jgi:hypothetical protein
MLLDGCINSLTTVITEPSPSTPSVSREVVEDRPVSQAHLSTYVPDRLCNTALVQTVPCPLHISCHAMPCPMYYAAPHHRRYLRKGLCCRATVPTYRMSPDMLGTIRLWNGWCVTDNVGLGKFVGFQLRAVFTGRMIGLGMGGYEIGMRFVLTLLKLSRLMSEGLMFGMCACTGWCGMSLSRLLAWKRKA